MGLGPKVWPCQLGRKCSSPCPGCPNAFTVAGLQFRTSYLVPRDELRVEHPDGRVDRFKIDCDS